MAHYARDGATMTTTPITQISAPSRSHLSGLNLSTTTPQASASAMNTPPSVGRVYPAELGDRLQGSHHPVGRENSPIGITS
jgi:hypothetical protein